MNNVNFCCFTSTGQIVKWGVCSDIVAGKQGDPGQTTSIPIDAVPDPANQYIKNGNELVPRPVSPVTISGTTLSNVPVPSVVRVNDTDYPTTTSTVALTLTYPGLYTIRVFSFPYKDFVTSVTVT